MIAVDIGSTAIRSIAFDAAGTKLAVGARQTPVRSTPAGLEYDPEAIFAAALATLAEVGRALAGRPVAGIAATSIGESCVLIDDAGRPLAPAIVWHDRRTLAEMRQIEEALGRERIFAITGHAVEPIFTLAKLMWMRKHWPEAVARARRVLMMADWIAYRLCGVAASEPMLASRTLYYDIRRGTWSEDLLALAGFKTSFPAPLKPSGTPLGPVKQDIRALASLAGSPIVVVGGHDHVIGAMATGLFQTGTAIDSGGTAEGVMMAAAAPLDDPNVIRRGFIQGAIATDRAAFYLIGGIVSAGAAMEWLRSITGIAAQATLIAEAANVPAGSGGVVFVPYLGGAPPPEPDPRGRGAFLGLTAETTAPALYRAILEGLALQARLLLDGMTSLTGIGPASRIRVIGGITRNPLYVAIKANAFGRPISVVDEPETTALGTALLAGVGAGILPTFDAAVAGLRLKETTWEPDGSAEFYDGLRSAVFAGIHDRLTPINHALHRLQEIGPTADPGCF